MTTINAQTIINAINAAAAVAPEYRDSFVVDHLPTLANGAPFGFDGSNEAEATGLWETLHTARNIGATMVERAAAELRDLQNTPNEIKFQTSARGFMVVQNTRERLEQFAATVRSKAAAFGGGLIKTPKARPTQPWSAGACKMVRELIQDHDYSGALDLATAKAGALFYKNAKEAFMLLAPMDCTEIPGMVSAQHANGCFCVFEPVSGYSINTRATHKTRANAIADAVRTWEASTNIEAAMTRARANPCDQVAAREAWCIEHGLTDQSAIDARIATKEAADIDAQAAQDVAQLVAHAEAAAAIEQACESAQVQELGTASESELAPVMAAQELATVCEVSSASHADTLAHGNTHSTPHAPSGKGQSITSKSGHWSARFFSGADGRPALEFTGPDGAREPVQAFDTGRERMQALQTMARLADDIAAGFDDSDEPEQRRAPRPFENQSTEFELRGITWKIEVSRYWSIDTVSAQHQPDLLCWNAYKKGGRFDTLTFCHVAGDKLPRDVAARAHAFFQSVERADQCTAPADATQAPVQSPAIPESETPQDVATDPAAIGATGTPGLSITITITRAEGKADECGRPVTVTSFADADALLHTWSHTAPKNGCYNKCDFSISWPNGSTYTGRYDLKHHEAERPSLTAHMVDLAEFHTGKNCPNHMSETAYQQFLARQDDETTSAYAEVLALMVMHGNYFPKVRPVSIDLRALLGRGMDPAELVGLGVVYCGDRLNPDGAGAITSAEPCKWYGVNMTVTLEDGRTLNGVNASDFGGKLGDRFRLDMKRHGAPYLAQLGGAVATVKASASAAKEQAAKAYAKELQDLAQEYPQLKRHTEGAKLYGVTLAAANVRILLKTTFPNIKFSVTCEKYSMGNSLRVSWTDGPRTKQVDAIVDRFSAGHFNGMEDIYEYKRSAFTELFGSAKHTSTQRDLSDVAVSAIIAQEWPNADGRPTVEDYRKNANALRDESGRSRVYMASVNWSATSNAASL